MREQSWLCAQVLFQIQKETRREENLATRLYKSNVSKAISQLESNC